jgi:hypothetical protein
MPILGVVASSRVSAVQAYESLGNFAPSGSTLSITSIPSTYRYLRLVGRCADNRNVAYSGINITLNGDSGGNYWFSYLVGDNRSSSTSAGSYNNDWTTSFGFNVMGGPTSSGSYAMFSMLDFYDYADTSKKTTVMHRFGWGDAANTSYVIRSLTGKEQGFWNSTSAVSSITITTPFGPFRNTEYTLYGIKD